MDTLFGLPAHPLFVHIPIVLLPLAAIGVVVLACKPTWHRRYRWVVLALGAAGTLGIVLAASAGEKLEERIINVEGAAAAAGFQHHTDLGETARNVALVFMVLLAAFVLLPWWLERRGRMSGAASSDSGDTTTIATTTARERWLRIGVAVLAVAGAVASVTTVIQAGHTGSKAVWEGFVDSDATGGG